MAGTLSGGKQAAKTNKKRYGKNFYRKIGSIGGKNGTTGGFWADRDNARKAGALGGTHSKRGMRFIRETKTLLIYSRISDGEEVRYRK